MILSDRESYRHEELTSHARIIYSKSDMKLISGLIQMLSVSFVMRTIQFKFLVVTTLDALLRTD